MNFTLGNQKWRGSDTQLGNQKWKPTGTQNVFPSNSRPYKNVDPEIKDIVGPYPVPRAQSAPVTTTKTGILIRDPVTGIRYPSLTFGSITCTNVGTSIPTCYKKYSRPVKIWRKQLFKNFESSSNLKPTIDQINAPGTVIQSQCNSKTNVLYTDITRTTKCDGIRTEKGCISGTNAIRRSASSLIDKNYCTTTREYLQKRCKTYDQNQTIGERISGTTFKSGTCTNTGNITGDCNVIQYKPSNNKDFKTQGGVSASSRTSLLKYKALQEIKNQTQQKNVGLKIYKNNQCFKVIDNRAVAKCN